MAHATSIPITESANSDLDNRLTLTLAEEKQYSPFFRLPEFGEGFFDAQAGRWNASSYYAGLAAHAWHLGSELWCQRRRENPDNELAAVSTDTLVELRHYGHSNLDLDQRPVNRRCFNVDKMGRVAPVVQRCALGRTVISYRLVGSVGYLREQATTGR